MYEHNHPGSARTSRNEVNSATCLELTIDGKVWFTAIRRTPSAAQSGTGVESFRAEEAAGTEWAGTNRTALVTNFRAQTRTQTGRVQPVLRLGHI
jgi:hypothetical protein